MMYKCASCRLLSKQELSKCPRCGLNKWIRIRMAKVPEKPADKKE